MSATSGSGSTSTGSTGTPAGGEPTTGRLVHDLTEQTRELVRGEMALAKAELSDTVKHAGIGAGLFGGAGVIALYGVGALVAAAIAGLAVVLDVWLAALIVGAVLLAVAGVAALLGKKQVTQATPAVPATQRGVQRDVATLKEGTHRG
ncbi:hypothetical protein ENKNEFLB_04420 [Nocardioides aquaticus]|uniref:Phage holin family protein n=1 Tax=Nocardioides aquaticus TaxID=160826 RepID=A0ABX8ENP2_9ACTN|nr:phage holin family protein [Nocardioides aquaticus]QVT82001.1 hypothetical protein ENKNEFLB_04420 [Nocardioides aquaticus]